MSLTARVHAAVLIALVAPLVPAYAATISEHPSVRDVLSVPTPDNPRLSPDGSTVAFTLRTADWEHDRYDTELLAFERGGAPKQLTTGAQSVNDPRWSPDGKSIAFMSDTESGPQVFVVASSGGKPRAVTALPAPVMGYEWSPDGQSMAVLVFEAPNPNIDARVGTYGRFSVFGESPMRAHLWLVDVKSAVAGGGAKFGAPGLRRITDGNDFSVVIFSVPGLRNSFSFSPDGTRIAFVGAPSAEILEVLKSYVGIVDIATGKVRNLSPNLVAWQDTPVFSPDGRQVLFSSTLIDDYPVDNRLLIVPADGGAIRELTPKIASADHQPLVLDWQSNGIHVFYLDRTRQQVYRVDPDTGATAALTSTPATIVKADVSSDGRTIAALGFDGSSASDVYRIGADQNVVRISNATAALASWPRHHVELVTWKSADGVQAEGVLYTPEHIAAGAHPPLIVVLHGGPRELANPQRLHNKIYPVEQWLAQGAVVFFPNYRGSTGYGIAFERMSLHDIGHAEGKDVYSGIDYLARERGIDLGRVAVVGHSWGGYLSAYLSASGDRFKAALVDSGIVDNRINYVLSNAGVGREGYLRSTPWERREYWDLASAVGHLDRAKTPTLILHGDSDPVVPVANAYVLQKGLSDMGVPVRLVLFKDTDHNIERPREQMAAMMMNWQWLTRYLWNEDAVLPWEAAGNQ